MDGIDTALQDRLAIWATRFQRLCSLERARKAAALKEQMRALRAMAEPVREGRLRRSPKH